MLPTDIVANFRTHALADLERIEIVWAALVEQFDAGLSAELQRRLHTIKGDSRVVGFTDVNLVCQRLEDLVDAAQKRQFKVSEELDLVATMAMQFIATLLQKRVGSGKSSLDLAGFVRQVDAVLGNRPPSRPMAILKLDGADGLPAAITGTTREQLAELAARVWLEERHAPAAARERLQAIWHSLRALAAEEFVELGARVAHHAAAARTLARQLGKQIRVRMDVGDVRVPAHIAATVNVVLVHLCSNAVDHGIGTPDERAAGGKDPIGSVEITARDAADHLEIVVHDDGRGVDFVRVHARAIELGLCSADDAPSEEELTYLLFYPGFSSRTNIGEVSGRGVGLDSVKEAITSLGGEVQIASVAGRGTCFTLKLPLGRRQLEVRRFGSAAMPVCIDARWEAKPTGEAARDPLARLGFATVDGRATELNRGGERVLCMLPAATGETTMAERICPAEEAAAEIVLIDGDEALLVRPERLAD